jgi:hypothetical protein
VRKLLLLLLLLCVCSGCAGTKFYFFGVDTDIITEASRGDALKAAAGVVTSVAAHVGGHYLMAEVTGVTMKQVSWTKEEMTNGSRSDYRWCARGGFMLQHGFGLVLTSFETTRYSYFTKGYVVFAAAETWVYPLVNRGHYNDFKTSEDNHVDYAIFSGIALHNVLRVPWERDYALDGVDIGR